MNPTIFFLKEIKRFRCAKSEEKLQIVIHNQNSSMGVKLLSFLLNNIKSRASVYQETEA